MADRRFFAPDDHLGFQQPPLLAGKYTGRHWIDFIIFGLAQGSIYALIATGYTMVYGVLKMINFAHGEVFMSGPYTAYLCGGRHVPDRFPG